MTDVDLKKIIKFLKQDDTINEGSTIPFHYTYKDAVLYIPYRIRNKRFLYRISFNPDDLLQKIRF